MRLHIALISLILIAFFMSTLSSANAIDKEYFTNVKTITASFVATASAIIPMCILATFYTLYKERR